jgi:hypothetical protein
MKFFVIIIVSALALPTYGQRLLKSLESYQQDIEPKSSSNKSSSAEVKVEIIEKTKSNGECKEETQTSLPLAYISSLILEKDGKLEITHDPRTGKLKLSSPEMISNCSSMIEWKAKSKIVEGRKIYSLEAKIKEGESCSESGCSYSVAKVDKGQFKNFEKLQFKPTMSGFEECLENSGVIKDGKVVKDSIYPGSLDEKFEGFKESGDLLFVSNGPSSRLVKSKYDKFVEIDRCDFFEKIVPEGFIVKSLEQEERERIEAEKKTIEGCGDYNKISDFIEKYQGYSEELNKIRDTLILDAVKKAVKNIGSGKYTEDDLKAIADFEKYMVKPKVDLAADLYEEAQDLEGDEQVAKLAEVKAILDEIAVYNKEPYITAAIVQKLEADGRFDDAQVANGIKALIVGHSKLGQKVDGVVVTGEVALAKSQKLINSYAAEIVTKKENYEVRTGQVTGQSKIYTELARKMRQNIQVRTQNFSQEINAEYARTQRGGYCYRPYRNVQRCIQESMQRIQELQAQLQHFNKVDAERAIEYDQKAQEYATLEKEGRNYVARQNGEAVEETTQTTEETTTPQARTDEAYTFNFQGYQNQQQQQGQQQQYYQQQQQQFNNPYQQQYNMNGNFGSGFGGQYGYYGQGANMGGQQGPYNFSYQGSGYNPYQQSMFGNQANPYQQQYGNPYGQQQQQGFWGSPYQAYGNFNMYGGFR